MKRLLAPWLLLLVVIPGGITAIYIGCPGCIDRNRVNKTCEWTGDSAFRIDPQNAAHQKHLVADAQLAEELAVRYADAEFNRLYGYEAHGGLIEHGRVRNECMARLVATIENSHGITTQQVAIARGQRNRLFDVAVGLLFLPVYCFGATVVCLVLRRRFSSDRRHVGLLAKSLTSVAASFIGVQVGELWLDVWEAVRVGNGHMSSFRAATSNRWSQQHHGAELVGGILLFWVIALFYARVVWDEKCS